MCLRYADATPYATAASHATADWAHWKEDAMPDVVRGMKGRYHYRHRSNTDEQFSSHAAG